MRIRYTHTHAHIFQWESGERRGAAERHEMGQYYVAIEFGHFWLSSSVGHLGTVAAITVTQQQFTPYLCACVCMSLCASQNKLDKTNYNYKHTHIHALVFAHIHVKCNEIKYISNTNNNNNSYEMLNENQTCGEIIFW